MPFLQSEAKVVSIFIQQGYKTLQGQRRSQLLLRSIQMKVPLIKLPNSSLDGFIIHSQVGVKKGKQTNTPSSYKPKDKTASWWLLLWSQFLSVAVVAHMKRLESASRRRGRSFKSVKYGGKLSSASSYCTFHHMTCELSRNLAHFTVGGREEMLSDCDLVTKDSSSSFRSKILEFIIATT